MKSDRTVIRLRSPSPSWAALRESRPGVRRRRAALSAVRLGVEQLCERVLLTGVPYASEPALVQQVSAIAPCLRGGELTFSASKAAERCVTGTISEANDEVVREFRVEATGRLVLEMTAADSAAESAFDGMLWLYRYDQHGESLLVTNDDQAAHNLAPRISQRLTEGTYRLKVTASPAAATPAAQHGMFSVNLAWQPTADISVAETQIEGGKEGAAIADLDGDGHTDIAAVNDDNELRIAYGIGDGSFRAEVTIAQFQGGASRRIAAGNFDGVGGLDLAVALVQEQVLVLITNGAHGTWDTSRVNGDAYDISGAPDAMTAADLNGDLLDDLLVPVHEQTHRVYYGDRLRPFEKQTSFELKDAAGNIVKDGRGAVVGQFDGKNGPDIAIAVKAAGKIYVLLNEGTDPQTGLATFSQSDVVPTGPLNHKNPGTEGIAVGDFNGDGWFDLASVNDKSDTVSVRLNKGLGDGRFDHAGGDFKVGVDSEVLRVADFNEDGVDDIVVTNEDTHNVSVLIGLRGPDGNGTGEFQPRVLYPCGFRPTDLGIGDFNEDGFDDVTVKLDGGGLTFLFGLGDGTFLVPDSTSLGDDPDAIVAADFNADGFLDVAVANLLSHEVSVLLGRGDGGFATQVRYQLEEGAYPHAIAVGDINNDGRLDLTTANEGTDDLSILLGLGNGQFLLHEPSSDNEEHSLAVGDSPWALAVDDFDGDGRVDIATANRKSNSVTVFYGTAAVGLAFDREDYDVGTGNFPERLVVDKDSRGSVVALATINRLTRDFSVFTFTPGLRGASAPVVTGILPFANSLAPNDVPVWMIEDRAKPRPDVNGAEDTSPMRFLPRTVTTADMNNDDLTDAIMIDDRTHATWVMLGRGDGTFGIPIQFPVSFDPEYVVAEDLDSDGNVDLLIGHDTDDLVVLYYGRGDGTFDDGEAYEANDGPERVIVADFDGDARPDFAIANDDDGTLQIWMQRSTREFTEIESPIPVAEGAKFQNGAAAGRFAGDGRLDLAVFDRLAAEATVHILVGRGDGTFDFEPSQSIKLPVPEGVAPKVEFLAAADLDLDGDDDVVAAEMSANRVWILWSDNGAFTVDQRFFDGGNPSGTADLDIRPVVVADLNGDHYPDIATVDKLFDKVTVLKGAATTEADRSAAFDVHDADHIDVGRHPGTLAVGDFNGDKRPDLIVGNRGSYDLSVLTNVSEPGGAIAFSLEQRIGRTSGDAPSAVADFNRDGYPDRISTREIENDLTIELGRGVDEDADGELDFDLATNGVHGAVVNPIVFDLNGDGRDDVLSLNYRGEILVRYREAATAAETELIRYAPPQVVNPGMPVRDIALVRSASGVAIAAAELMDADDSQTPRASAGRVGIYRRASDGHFERAELATAAGAANVAAGDLDGDGQDELVVYSTFTEEASVFRLNIQGSFVASGDRIHVGASVADIALVNVAGGKGSGVDLVVASRAASTILVFVGNGDGTLATAPQIAARAGDEVNWPYGYDPAQRAVASVHDTAAAFSGDLNGDDSPDLVTINRATNSLAVLLGKDQHSLSAPRSISLDGSPTAATIGDVNGDGNADLVVLYADGNADVMLGNGTGAFPTTKRTFVGQGATGVWLAQVDAGAALDILVSNRFGDVLTRLGEGDGTFRELRRADISLFLVVEDVDGDGEGDYIFTNESRDRIEVRTSSTADFEQDADDGLLAPGKAVVVDLNGDEVLDFAVPNYGENVVIVYLGTAPGVFARGSRYPAGGNPVHITQADLNGDDAPDLVVANAGSNDVVVLYGEGEDAAWKLRLGPRLKAGEGPVHTTIGDATSDGVADIVVTNERDNSVFALPGRGGGFFDDRPGSIVPFVNVGLQRPVQSFFSGSGFATLNSGSNSLTFFANSNPRSARSFDTFGSRPVAAVMGDFDFDRRTELIVAHELDGLFSVFSADADGFTLIRSQHFVGLSHPTDLAVWNDRGQILVFGVGDGRETAVLLFAGLPDTAFDVERFSQVDSGFEDLGERYLPFLVSLVYGDASLVATLAVDGTDETPVAADWATFGSEAPSDKLPEEWFPVLDEEPEETGDGAENGSSGGVPWPGAGAEAESAEETDEAALSKRTHDFFFDLLTGEFGPPSRKDEATTVADDNNVVPVGTEPEPREATRVRTDVPSTKRSQAEPAALRNDAASRSEVMPAPQSALPDPRQKTSAPFGPRERTPASLGTASAAALVFAKLSAGSWTPREHLSTRRPCRRRVRSRAVNKSSAMRNGAGRVYAMDSRRMAGC